VVPNSIPGLNFNGPLPSAHSPKLIYSKTQGYNLKNPYFKAKKNLGKGLDFSKSNNKRLKFLNKGLKNSKHSFTSAVSKSEDKLRFNKDYHLHNNISKSQILNISSSQIDNGNSTGVYTTKNTKPFTKT